MTPEEKQEFEWHFQYVMAFTRQVIAEDRKFKAWMREAHKHGPEAIGIIVKRIMDRINPGEEEI